MAQYVPLLHAVKELQGEPAASLAAQVPLSQYAPSTHPWKSWQGCPIGTNAVQVPLAPQYRPSLV